jgi:Rieske 2Fe-2S family protein
LEGVDNEPAVAQTPCMADLSRIRLLLDQRRPGHALPQQFSTDPAIFAFDVDRIYGSSWIMVGFETELPSPGSTLALTIGRSPVLVVRGRDDVLRAFHNSCRHRGAQICADGLSRRPRLVCPYHQWAYDLEGRLVNATRMGGDFDPEEHALVPVSLRTVAGTVYVCLSDTPPAFDDFHDALEPMLAPHQLHRAKLAHEMTLVEKANWKLVMENARECYHCASNHPELAKTFPILRRSLSADEQREITDAFATRMVEHGLPSGPAEGSWWQAGRFPLNPGTTSMTLDGEPCVGRTMGRVGNGDVGSLRIAVEPHCFTHVLGDYAIMFSAMPTAPEETVVTAKWLVSGDAVEGMDYTVDGLTELWNRTNLQDRALAENNQRGVRSSGYRPGPYSPEAETLVLRFVDWYCRTVREQTAGALP